MNFRMIKDETKEALVGNRFVIFLMILVIGIVVSSLSSLGGLGIILSPITTAGMFLVCKHVMKQKKVELNLLFDPFKDINQAIKLIGVYLLTMIITALGMLLLIIPGIIFAFQYSQAINVMAENPEIGIWDAMKKSKEIMVGHKFELFVFGLSFIGHILLVIITIGIYAIYFIPYYQTAMVNYYLHITGQNGEDAEIGDLEAPQEEVNFF
jgi:uncharacterized membrane protein